MQTYCKNKSSLLRLNKGFEIMINIIVLIIGFILGICFDYIGSKLPLKKTKRNFKFSILTIIIGLLNSILSLFFYNYYGFGYNFIISIVLSSLLILIYISDIKYFIILDSPLVISFIIIFISKWLFFDLKTSLLGILDGLILFLFMLLVGYLGTKLFKKESLGGGDIKLSFIIGYTLGLPLGFTSLALSTFLALPYALYSMFTNKEHEIAFGPFLISALWMVFIFSDKFTNLINFLFK